MYTTELVFNDSNKDVTPRNIKGVIDFNRISNSNFGSYFDEISRNSNNPPLGMYQPKYNFIEKKTVDIYIDKLIKKGGYPDECVEKNNQPDPGAVPVLRTGRERFRRHLYGCPRQRDRTG